MQILGVIKNLIIIHLGSMREHIRPNRWINSERGDERLRGRLCGTPSVRLCFPLRPALCRKTARGTGEGCFGLPLDGLVSLSELEEHCGFCSSRCLLFKVGCMEMKPLCYITQAVCLDELDSPIHSWVVKTFFLPTPNLH